MSRNFTVTSSFGVILLKFVFEHLCLHVTGRKAYMKHLDKIYKRSDISWFTPVELFKVISLHTPHCKMRNSEFFQSRKSGFKRFFHPHFILIIDKNLLLLSHLELLLLDRVYEGLNNVSSYLFSCFSFLSSSTL